MTKQIAAQRSSLALSCAGPGTGRAEPKGTWEQLIAARHGFTVVAGYPPWNRISDGSSALNLELVVRPGARAAPLISGPVLMGRSGPTLLERLLLNGRCWRAAVGGYRRDRLPLRSRLASVGVDLPISCRLAAPGSLMVRSDNVFDNLLPERSDQKRVVERVGAEGTDACSLLMPSAMTVSARSVLLERRLISSSAAPTASASTMYRRHHQDGSASLGMDGMRYFSGSSSLARRNGVAGAGRAVQTYANHRRTTDICNWEPTLRRCRPVEQRRRTAFCEAVCGSGRTDCSSCRDCW